MIKRTPQEIADFFGCYVFQGRDRDSFYMTKGKPGWNGADFTLHCDGMLSLIDKSVVDIPADHDWTHLYEPQSGNQGKTEEDFPNHISEVYTHKEYRVVEAGADELTSFFEPHISDMISNGWEPIGGVFISGNTYHQAMVRGV